ncbi:NADH-quinone oxidoreductase subunit NuoE [Chloroflexota bacterium]
METETKDQLADILKQYEGKSNELIPILQEAQEKFGYLPGGVIPMVARFLRIAESNVFGVTTFYAQFRFTPVGEKIIKVCRGTACHIKGGKTVLESIQRVLGIQPGETTADLKYSLEVVACIGACALAPAVMIGNEVQRKMTPKKIAELFGDGRKTDENAK